MSLAYRRGYNFERRVIRDLESKGYFVARQARSSFPDLIAIKDGEVLLIECKVRGYLSKKERERIEQIKAITKAKFLVARRVKRRIVYEEC